MILSYAICVHDESEEIFRLLTFLQHNKYSNTENSEIVVLQDGDDENVSKTLKKFSDVKVFHRKLDGDFAAHKNFLGSKCTGKYIFNIDADEMITENIISTVIYITRGGVNDLVYFPRINICIGYTEAFIKKHNFNVNSLGWINWPDYQGRLYKNGLQWGGVVHEKIQGATNATCISHSDPTRALMHIKTVQRQDCQNALYAKLEEKN
jgi:glycosyltransferase involved in cell wall biosynthesis